MDNRQTPNSNDEMIEDALRTYPVASLDKDLVSAVLSQIRQTSAPRFRVRLSDFVLAVVFTVVLAAAWFGFQSLPALVILQLRIQGILLWQSILVNARWLVPVPFFAPALLLSGLAIPSLLRMSVDDRR